ncbi:MAG: H-NS histone family protein [Telluria sp.]
MTDTTDQLPALPQLDPLQKVQQIHAQIAQLQEQATLLMQEGRNNAVATAMALIAAYNLKPEDVGFPAAAETQTRQQAARKPRPSRATRPPKYRDPVSGATWTGQGAQPRWLDGKNREDYLIVKPETLSATPPAAPAATPPSAALPSYASSQFAPVAQGQVTA